MYILDVISNDKGQLYTQKLPLQNGLFLTIKHTITNKLSVATKQIHFLHVSYNRIGDRFIACDLYGNIYMFDLNYNRYMRLNRIGTSCTALSYNLKCKTEYLVATIDGTIKCFNAETKDLVGWMKGHEKPIISLSVHTNGELVISFSSDIAQLWDLKTFECKQKLNINSKQNVEIIKISFAPHTNDIVSAFKDDTIYVWSSETIELKCQFTVDENDMIFYKCYTISFDGKLLVAAGKSNKLYIWSIEMKNLIKIINLGNKIENIKDCVLLAGPYENKILILLTHDGLIEVINIENDKHLLTLNSTTHQNANEKITNMTISNLNSPRYLNAVTESGFIQVYDLDSSCIAKHKATNALMKSTTINSTNNAASASISNTTKSIISNLSIATNQSKQQQQPQKLTQKQIVCKRAQTILNNDQIYSKLVQILKCYGEYPARYRMFIWKLLLKLPENYESYGSLIEKGVHPAFIDLHKKYPIKSQKCNRLLERTLSVLANWSPIFAECEYLPLLVFPFVKLFQNNHVICFEIIVTFINNWCQHWFEFFPNPPLNILNMIENLIAYHDKALIEHFMRYRITSQIFGWSLLETIFSEVFSKNEWQILFDNIFSNHPGYMIYLAAAYSICNRSSLVKVTEIDDAKFFYRHRNPLSVQHLIREASRMQESTPSDINPNRLLKHFEPLHKGNYPVFNKRPKFISDYQAREKQKILQEEVDYLKERDNHIESHKLNEGKKLENEYLLKQMLWDKQIQLKPTFQQFKKSLDDYDDAQKNAQISVNVAGEPLKLTDSNGFTYMNKMRCIDENFDEIENKVCWVFSYNLVFSMEGLMIKNQRSLNANRQQSAPAFENPNDQDETDFDIQDVENEIMRNFSASFSNKKMISANVKSNANVAVESKMRSVSQNKCLNETESTTNSISASTSTLISLDRGRQNLENQERDLMKRVYEMRKNIALDNRKQTTTTTKADKENKFNEHFNN